MDKTDGKPLQEVDTKPIESGDACRGQEMREHPNDPNISIPREGLPCSYCWQMAMGTLEELKVGQQAIRDNIRAQDGNIAIMQVEVQKNRKLIQHLMQEVLGDNMGPVLADV